MKILVAGSDINAVLITRYIKLQNPEHEIYLTVNGSCEDNSYIPVNIKENDVSAVCNFVKYNQIEFTIVTSKTAIINGIADIFKKEGFPVFAPFSEAARITFFNSIAKKVMYKLKINTPKFGIFDRENLAVDYIRHSKFPIAIEKDFTLVSEAPDVCNTFSSAKRKLQEIFDNNNEKIVIENYMEPEPVYIYFITDGFNALPLIAAERSSGKFYMTAAAPSQKLPDDTIINIMHHVIYPLLDDISKYAEGYTGILGLKIKLQKNNFYVLEFYNGFQYYDFQTFLSLADENLLDLLYDAATGSLTDNRSCVNLTDRFAYTAAINKNKIINGNNENDFTESEDTDKLIITNTASTLNYAKENLYDYLETICDEDVYREIINSSNKEEHGI